MHEMNELFPLRIIPAESVHANPKYAEAILIYRVHFSAIANVIFFQAGEGIVKSLTK